VKTYTDKDVEKLVDIADQINRLKPEASYKSFGENSVVSRKLVEALAPFLPDPEEQLIEKMTAAVKDAYYTFGRNPTHNELARAAFAVVKQEGLPK